MDLSAIKIKRYRTARTIKLRIHDDGKIIVTAHPLTSDRQIKKFLEAHQEWIDNNLEKVSNKLEHLTMKKDTLLFHGKEYDFRLAVHKTKKPSVDLSEKLLLVTTKEESHTETRKVLERWYKKQAKTYFTERVPLLADLVNKPLKNVTIRSQRTRWGSCSSRNTISLNWRLIQAPDWVSDYVIYHELAHLTHMNHSKNFWSLVEDYFPQYKEAERWLKSHRELLNF